MDKELNLENVTEEVNSIRMNLFWGEEVFGMRRQIKLYRAILEEVADSRISPLASIASKALEIE